MLKAKILIGEKFCPYLSLLLSAKNCDQQSSEGIPIRSHFVKTWNSCPIPRILGGGINLAKFTSMSYSNFMFHSICLKMATPITVPAPIQRRRDSQYGTLIFSWQTAWMLWYSSSKQNTNEQQLQKVSKQPLLLKNTLTSHKPLSYFL